MITEKKPEYLKYDWIKIEKLFWTVCKFCENYSNERPTTKDLFEHLKLYHPEKLKECKF